MVSHIEKVTSGWPRGHAFPVQTDRYSFWRGRWHNTREITVIGRVRVVQGDRIVVLDDRSWNHGGGIAESLEKCAVIMDGPDPYHPTVHPVDVEIETGEIYLPGGGTFGRRWMYDEGLKRNWFGLPDHPVRILDVFDRDAPRTLIEVPD